jgi:penicillin-binding protein 2
METRFGPIEALGGDGTEKFQDYMRVAGFGHDTGIDLPNEFDGRVPDERWCEDNADIGYCPDGWLPGYSVNMSIGQGDLLVTPLQMAVSYAAIANGGLVMQPRVAQGLAEVDEITGETEIVREFKPKMVRRLQLDATELGVIQEGLVDVVSGANGTANYAFSGFPTDRYPIAGKTGTAQIGESDLNYAWFASYAPADDPQYLIVAYLERAGHGGESAAPVARQIYEGIFGIDKQTDVRLGYDRSG